MNRATPTQIRQFKAKAIGCLVGALSCVVIFAPGASAGNGGGDPCAYPPFLFSTAIAGTGSSDFLVGDNRGNQISGLGGNDQIFGCGGNDNISGGADNDDIRGGFGDDYLSGDSGNDRIIGGPGFDVAVGGSGFDQCDAEVEVSCEANPNQQ